MDPRLVMQWYNDIWMTVPRWLIEPDQDVIAKHLRQRLELQADDGTIAFFNEGTFNKLYLFEYSKGSFVMLVTLPVDPCHKTESEVATLKLLGSTTSLPVPEVILYSADCDDIGFEYTLMEKMPGITLEEAWKNYDLDKKKKVCYCFSRHVV